MYPNDDIQKEIQDLWALLRVIKSSVNPAALFGTWFAGGTGINGAVGHADSPFTPSLTTPVLIPVDTTGGAVIINTTSGTLSDGQVLFLKDITGNAGVVPINFKANNGGGETVEDPGNEGHFVAGTVNVTAQGAFVGWKWQKASNRWIGWMGF